MKKLIPILLAVFALASCEKDPDMGKLDDNYLVYTNYDKQANFKDFSTFYLALSAKLLLNGTLNCQSILAYPLSDSCALAGMAKAMAMAASATTLKYIFFLVFITVVVVYLLVR